MTTIPSIRIICDICKKDVELDEQYYRIDTMRRSKPTYHKQRQMKHICERCLPYELKLRFNEIKREK